MKHTHDVICPSCSDKLALAHPSLQSWFNLVKIKFPDIHISWSFRDELDQNNAFKDKTSNVEWPNSAHNKTPACALDLFQLNENGIATFDPVYMAKIQNSFPDGIKWGGNFVQLKDWDHFELQNET